MTVSEYLPEWRETTPYDEPITETWVVHRSESTYHHVELELRVTAPSDSLRGRVIQWLLPASDFGRQTVYTEP